jgi:serine/threonine-protein kinase HipA
LLPAGSICDEGKIFLAKFSHPGDQWDVMAWEKVSLDIAAAAGVEVPESRLVKVAGFRREYQS